MRTDRNEHITYTSMKSAGAARGGSGHRTSRARRRSRRNTYIIRRALAGALTIGIVAGAAFYGGRVSAAKASAAQAGTSSLWEAIPANSNASSSDNVDADVSSPVTETQALSSQSANGGVIQLASTSDESASAGSSSVSTGSTSAEGTGSGAPDAAADSAEKTGSSSGDLSVTEVAKKGMSSVVAITNTIKYANNGYQMFGSGDDTTAEAAASGSGVIIGITDDEVLIVTNHHVIEDASELSVQFADGNSVDADIKGEDTSADLAVIAVQTADLSSDTLNQISAVTFADSDSVEVGEQVVAIGNALGYGQSVTTGIISAKDRDLTSSDGTTEEGLLQTDAAINPGNSGGALLNMKGELVGINVAKYSSTDVEGMGYSIPSNKVAAVVSQLSTKTTRSVVDENDRGYLGITTATINASVAETYGMPRGIYVYSITDGSGAADSDLQKGDIITAFDGQNVTSADDLSDLLKYYKAGETVTLTVERKNGDSYEEKEISVTLGAQPSTQSSTSNSGSGQSGATATVFSFFR